MVPLDDHSTLIDELERLPLVDKLATAVMTCTPPRVYGVHGDWGAGKTSFLHQLNCRLDGIPARAGWVARQNESSKEKTGCAFPNQFLFKHDPVVVWFEAWRYQHEPAPVVALLHEMRGQLGKIVRATNWGKKIGETVIRSALLQLEQFAKFAWLQSAPGITVGRKGAGLVATIQDQGERWERENLAEKLPAEAIREHLEHAINQLLGRKKNQAPEEGRRVIILIDDLDRCDALATYRLLEGIKIYLNLPNCVFVLGMDQRIIEEAIADTAPGAKDDPDLARRRAREYLEKLFQEIYYLPIVQLVGERLMAWLPPDAGAAGAETRGVLKELLVEYDGCSPANPRKVKAYAAVLHRFIEQGRGNDAKKAFPAESTFSEPAAQRPYESLLLILSALHLFHAEIYRIVEAHTEAFYEKLWEWCASTVESKDQHACFTGLDRAYRASTPSERGADKLPEMTSLQADYSRGNVLRVQKLIYQARPYTEKQIRALLLK